MAQMAVNRWLNFIRNLDSCCCSLPNVPKYFRYSCLICGLNYGMYDWPKTSKAKAPLNLLSEIVGHWWTISGASAMNSSWLIFLEDCVALKIPTC